ILMNSQLGSSVKGTFYHDDRYKYTCPDIKVSYTLDKSDNQHDSIYTIDLASARIWKPQADDFVVDVSAKPPVAADLATIAPQPGPKADTVAAAAPIASTTPLVDPVVEDNKRIAESFTKRKAVLNREFTVESDSVRLSFYDNGDIDGDSISVFVNSQLALTHQELAAKAFNIFLHLDPTKEVNEVSMFAENLGRIPPNTALMVLTDGKNRYEVYLSSSLTENATIHIRRKKPL
ncbi:MAG: hypothetical protein JST68_28985, partial [Bacteroidetes bacterium]|nr:hypothetical protein [Bacteroidota bacterium]